MGNKKGENTTVDVILIIKLEILTQNLPILTAKVYVNETMSLILISKTSIIHLCREIKHYLFTKKEMIHQIVYIH